MYKFLFLALPALILAGCASSPSPDTQVKQIIEKCANTYGIPASEAQAMGSTLSRISDSLAKADPAALKTLTPQLEKARLWVRHVEVLAIHDHCMPQMGRMVDLKKALGGLKTPSAPGGDTPALAIAALDSADQAMMAWMHAFRSDVPRQNIAFSTGMKYLDEQFVLVSRVDSQIFASMDRASALLSQAGNAK